MCIVKDFKYEDQLRKARDGALGVCVCVWVCVGERGERVSVCGVRGL